ncbi:craniofacial development protein 2-like [Montipora capricornis]|uniref:craniofacial development protein 2-like n=1 Tax=Montipora foliosa TaxID=591990 RepID=UPI0035F2001E
MAAKPSWNIRTLCPGFTDNPDLNLRVQGLARKTALLDREFTKLAIDIVTLQETRLAGSGSITEQHFTFFWSGKAEGEHRIHGVGFAVANKLLKDHLVDTPVGTSERIMQMKINCAATPVHLISVYAPTLPSEDLVKDVFYDTLNAVLSRIPPDDHVALLGDFNARVGANHAAWAEIIGLYGIGKMNENGQRVLELCS